MKHKKNIFFIFIFLQAHTLLPKIVLTSVPKCGTHLAIKCITAITGIKFRGHSNTWVNPSTIDLDQPFLAGHTTYTPRNKKLIEKKKSKGILILRDPRDQCISWIYFSKKNPDVWPILASMEFNDAISSWIENTSIIHSDLKLWNDSQILSFGNINDLYRRYLPWKNHPQFYTVTFERLVGNEGGGSSQAQITEILNIAQHLGYPIKKAEAATIALSLFGPKRTFRQGKIGAWKTHFTPEHKELFKKVAGNLLIELGYESDDKW